TAHGLERALAVNGAVAPTCRAATAAERAAGPFGRKGRLFTCRMTIHGERARYDMQVIGNRCFVAERHHRGRALYGCRRPA
ncbi:MAG: hypothetical protein ABI950_08285, partial [Solirubrobacteraceae bacterium]